MIRNVFTAISYIRVCDNANMRESGYAYNRKCKLRYLFPNRKSAIENLQLYQPAPPNEEDSHDLRESRSNFANTV